MQIITIAMMTKMIKKIILMIMIMMITTTMTMTMTTTTTTMMMMMMMMMGTYMRKVLVSRRVRQSSPPLSSILPLHHRPLTLFIDNPDQEDDDHTANHDDNQRLCFANGALSEDSNPF